MKPNRPPLLRNALLTAALFIPVSACEAPSPLGDDTVLISDGEVHMTVRSFKGIVDAAETFNIPLDNFGQLALCESAGNELRENKFGYIGLFSQGKQFWNKRYADFTKATGIILPNDIRNGRTNAFVSAWMLRNKMNNSKKIENFLSDWIQCKNGWLGKNNKSHFWEDIKNIYSTIMAEYLNSIENIPVDAIADSSADSSSGNVVEIISRPPSLAPLVIQ